MYYIVDHCFYFIWWLLKEPFVFCLWWFFSLVPRCIQVRARFQQPLGGLFIGLIFVHKLNSLVCSSRYLHRWFLLSFRLERRRICRTVSLAALFRSWMRRYNGSCLKARWLRPWCHPFYVVICPHGFFKYSLVWWGPGGAIDPVAGHLLSEGLQCDRSLTLEAVKHWPDFVLWQEG